MSAPKPPRAAERLLERFVPAGDFREALLGDLREAFSDSDGGHRAVLHYWLQVCLMIPRLWLHRTAVRQVSSPAGRRASLLATLLADVGFALRLFRRRRAFTTLMLLTTALGIGSATSMFSLVDGVVIRSLPFPDADRLVTVYRTVPRWRDDPVFRASWDAMSLAWPEYRDWRDEQTTFEQVGSWLWSVRTLSTDEGAEQVSALLASASLLDVLRVRPQHGRSFRADEEGWPPARVVLISDGLWSSRYARDPGVLQQTIVLNGEPHRIIGVLPAGLRVPGMPVEPPCWLPGGSQARDTQRTDLNYRAVARLWPRGTVAQAEAETSRLFRFGGTEEDGGARLVNLQADVTRTVRAPFVLLLCASGLLLVITCVNVAALLLGEGSRRESELATRLALGAGQWRLVRQLLTEQLVRAVLGAGLGILCAYWVTRTLVALAPAGTPRIDDVAVDWRSYLFAFAAALVTAVVFGLTPALTLVRDGVRTTIGSGTRASSRRGVLQRVAIGAQVGVAVVLLIGAALLVRSLQRLSHEPAGFAPEQLVHIRPLFGPDRPNATSQLPYVEEVLDAVRSLPGVVAASVSSSVPFTDGGARTGIQVDAGGVLLQSAAECRVVLPNLLRTVGIPLLEGRDLDAGDGRGARRVALVNRALAARSWPSLSALGRRVMVDGEWREVVGVVGDVKHRSLARNAPPTVYLPAPQTERRGYGFVLRVNADPAAVIGAARQRMRSVDASVAVARADVVAALIRATLAPERFRTAIITFFALAATLLTAVGLYGITSDAVARRRREIAIRVALGSTDASAERLVVRGTLVIAVAGAGIGVLMALGASRALTPYLYEVAETDAATYALVLAGTLGLTVLAAWLPARRARTVEPAELLRSE